MCPRENGTYHTMFMCDRYLNLSPTQAILGKVDEGNTWSELSHGGLYIIYHDLKCFSPRIVRILCDPHLARAGASDHVWHQRERTAREAESIRGR